ncbi:hypothetical protein QTP88_008920 [Uroleucon formosanum]
MFKYLNEVMNCFFELPSSLDNQPTTCDFAWLGSIFFFIKVFVNELLLIWTETFMILVWLARVLIHVYYLHPTRVDGGTSEMVMWYSSAAVLFIIILIVLGIFCFSTFTLLKYIKDIVLWIKLLGAIVPLAFKYCRAAISFAATVMVVAHSRSALHDQQPHSLQHFHLCNYLGHRYVLLNLYSGIGDPGQIYNNVSTEQQSSINIDTVTQVDRVKEKKPDTTLESLDNTFPKRSLLQQHLPPPVSVSSPFSVSNSYRSSTTLSYYLCLASFRAF